MKNANFFHRRRYALQILSAWLTLALPAFSWAQISDPLPSWNDTTPKKAIVAFVEKVTKEGSPDFVPAADRSQRLTMMVRSGASSRFIFKDYLFSIASRHSLRSIPSGRKKSLLPQ